VEAVVRVAVMAATVSGSAAGVDYLSGKRQRPAGSLPCLP
jgi:hypothetical protein